MSITERSLQTALVSFFVYLFLVVFEPFDLNLLEREDRAPVILGYAVLVLCVLMVIYVPVPLLFRRWFDESNWTVGRELVFLALILVVIGLCVAFYETRIGTRPISLFAIWESIGKALLIGLFPVSALVIQNQFRQSRKYQNSAEVLQRAMDNCVSVNATENSKALLEPDTQSESFQCSASDILFVKADGNYLEVHYLDQATPKRTILRMTITKAVAQLEDYVSFFRCHRSFLVNLDRVSRVSGNARGYELHFEQTPISVPVARGKSKELSSRLKAR